MPQYPLYILTATGDPVPCPCVMTWRTWFDTTDRTLVQDRLPSGTFVETIFLSLNHAFRPGPPVLWETRVDGGPYAQVVRYTSAIDAQHGHEALVNTIRQWEAALAARACAGEHGDSANHHRLGGSPG